MCRLIAKVVIVTVIWVATTSKTVVAGWEKTYGGIGPEYGYSVVQTVDGGYIVAGWTLSYGAGQEDMYLIKTNAAGDTVWTRTYGGTNCDYSYSLTQTLDGCYIIAGYTWSYGAGKGDVWLIKTDTAGDTTWTKTYGGPSWDCGYSVARTTDGGYIIAGKTCSYGAGEADVYLIKVDAYGVEEGKSEIRMPNDEILKIYPNPFCEKTVIRYSFPQAIRLVGDPSENEKREVLSQTDYTINDFRLTIYDLTGRLVKSFPTTQLNPDFIGTQVWDGKDADGKEVKSGVYFCRLMADGNSVTKKMVVLNK
ncbi:MAG: T9SS type A sorting domain-containing protein [bacterium]|nr:T9SS type A sorting domain-containing protein [bacterium]